MQSWWFTLDRIRYADEPYGVAFCLPAIEASTYEQMEDYPYYIDQGMMNLFKTINGAA